MFLDLVDRPLLAYLGSLIMRGIGGAGQGVAMRLRVIISVTHGSTSS